MTEPKRVTFTTLSSSVSAAAPLGVVGGGVGLAAGGGSNVSSTSVTSLRFGTDFLVDQPAASTDGRVASGAGNKSGNKTLRLSMELFPTDSCSYPEFNFSKLLYLEKKKIKKLKQKSNGFADPFTNENDDDVARIAKELEKKYGSTYGSGRGRSKKDDHCDIGLGYDESDSFIDNTEAYDEVIPEEVETLEGGFYINCGALEFKKLHTESVKTRTDEIIKMPNRARKRVLSSSSSSGDSSSTDDDDDDDEVDSGGEASSVDATAAKAAKNASNTAVPPLEKRPKTSTANASTSASASAGTGAVAVAKKAISQTQDHDSGNNNSNSSQKKKSSKSLGVGGSSTSNSPKPPSSVGSDSDKERVRQKTVKTTTVKDMLKAKRDNFLKMQEGGATGATGSSGSDAKMINGELKGAASKSSDDESTSSDDSGEPSDSDRSAPQGKKPKKSGNSEGANEKLRSMDTKLPDIDAEIVANVCNFKELVKAKNMIGKRFQFDELLTEVFLKIDEALLCIDKTQRNMVYAHLEYQLLLPKYYFLRKAKDLRVREEKQKSKRALGKLRKAIIEAMPGAIVNFEVELRKHAELQSASVNADHPPKMPKKKFPWNNNLRNLLYEVYQVRWTSYPVLGTRKETLEDFISVYMREKVVELWPSGWMRYEDLQREIEKRKAAAKKAKERKKAKEAISNAANAQTNSAANAASLQGSSPANAPLPATNSFLKQFEDFATGSRSSCANSDTESVASSSASNGLKRKNSDGSREPGARSKASKTNMIAAAGGADQRDVRNNNADNGGSSSSSNIKKQQQTSASSATTVEFLSTGKKLEHSLPNVMSIGVAANGQQQPAQALGITAPQSQPKHSKPSDPKICVIDLDKYRCPNDILQTSQQMLKTEPISPLGASINSNVVYRRDSSSESDGVEIVGIFPAKSLPLAVVNSKPRHKKNASNALPAISTAYHVDAANAALYSTAPTMVNTNNNNNNNNNTNANNNSKKLQSGINSKAKDAAGCSSALEFDPQQVVRALKELGDLKQLQQQSHLLPPNASKKDQNAQ